MIFLHSPVSYRASGADLQVGWLRRHSSHADDSYRLARDIRGIGFQTGDAIAMKLGIEKTAIVRVRSGLLRAVGSDGRAPLRLADGTTGATG